MANATTFEARRAELMALAEAAVNEHRYADFDGIKADIEKLDDEHKQELTAQANLAALNKAPVGIPGMVNAGGAALSGSPEPAAGGAKGDMYGSKEYRLAFMDAMLTGSALKMPGMVNQAEQTTTGDVGAVIPTTIVKKIYEKMESTGKIWSRITHTNFKGGVSVPTSSVKPTATWSAERTNGETQKKAVTSITFAYHKLTCKVALSFEVTVTTLDVFEATVADNIAEAMIKAVEKAMIKGTGSGQPKGVLTETVPAARKIEVAATNALSFKDLAAAEGALPESYENGAVWVMTKSTFMNAVISMVDGNGAPIMKEIIGVNGKPSYYIWGREVVLVDGEYLDSYADTVSKDTIFAFIFNFRDYIGNTNYAVTVRDYIDEATDDRIKKAIMLFDGKAVDTNSLVTLTKKKA